MGEYEGGDRWYHQPLWSGIVGGVVTAVIIGVGSFILSFTTSGGLVAALGGLTAENLESELRSNPQLVELLKGEQGPSGEIAIQSIIRFGTDTGRDSLANEHNLYNCPDGWRNLESSTQTGVSAFCIRGDSIGSF